MARKRQKRRLKMVVYYPLLLVAMALVCVAFVLYYPGNSLVNGIEKAEAEPEPVLPEPETLPTPTPEIINTGRCIPFYSQGKWGYKNTLGRVVIDPIYAQALEFEGEVAFAASIVEGAARYGLIDRQGAWLVEAEWDEVKPFSEGRACVKKNNKWGYIDTAGRLVIDTLYAEAYAFSGGLARVRTGGKFGYLDEKGAWAIENIYLAANDFAQNRAFVVAGAPGNEQGLLIDSAGETVADMKQKRGTRYSEGLAVLKMGADIYGYVNLDGKTAFSETFERAMPFSEGLAAVRKEGKWGYIDPNGNMAIEAKFSDAKSFSEGLAAVLLPRELRYCYIDAEGNEVIAPNYEEAGPFQDGIAIVTRGPETRLLDMSGEEKLLFVGSPPVSSKPEETQAAKPTATPKKTTPKPTATPKKATPKPAASPTPAASSTPAASPGAADQPPVETLPTDAPAKTPMPPMVT